MKTLHELKEETALREGYASWGALSRCESKAICEALLTQIAIQYKDQCVKVKLGEAAERAKIKYVGTFMNPYRYEVDKESILSLIKENNL